MIVWLFVLSGIVFIILYLTNVFCPTLGYSCENPPSSEPETPQPSPAPQPHVRQSPRGNLGTWDVWRNTDRAYDFPVTINIPNDPGFEYSAPYMSGILDDCKEACQASPACAGFNKQLSSSPNSICSFYNSSAVGVRVPSATYDLYTKPLPVNYGTPSSLSTYYGPIIGSDWITNTIASYSGQYDPETCGTRCNATPGCAAVAVSTVESVGGCELKSSLDNTQYMRSQGKLFWSRSPAPPYPPGSKPHGFTTWGTFNVTATITKDSSFLGGAQGRVKLSNGSLLSSWNADLWDTGFNYIKFGNNLLIIATRDNYNYYGYIADSTGKLVNPLPFALPQTIANFEVGQWIP